MTRRRCALAGAIAVMVMAGACEAPRDPALEARAFEVMEAHRAKVAAERAAQARGEALRRGTITQRTYDEGEVARLLEGIEGDGGAVRAEIRTPLGAIRCDLDAARAPQTVANFVGLATGALRWRGAHDATPQRRPFYDGLSFHRTIAGYIIQAGAPSSRVGDGPGWTIPRERGGNDAFERPGAIAMIEAGDGAHGSQFFITARATPEMSEGYGAFGSCEPVALVRRISEAPTLPPADGAEPSKTPKEHVAVEGVTITR